MSPLHPATSPHQRQPKHRCFACICVFCRLSVKFCPPCSAIVAQPVNYVVRHLPVIFLDMCYIVFRLPFSLTLQPKFPCICTFPSRFMNSVQIRAFSFSMPNEKRVVYLSYMRKITIICRNNHLWPVRDFRPGSFGSGDYSLDGAGSVDGGTPFRHGSYLDIFVRLWCSSSAIGTHPHPEILLRHQQRPFPPLP